MKSMSDEYTTCDQQMMVEGWDDVRWILDSTKWYKSRLWCLMSRNHEFYFSSSNSQGRDGRIWCCRLKLTKWTDWRQNFSPEEQLFVRSEREREGWRRCGHESSKNFPESAHSGPEAKSATEHPRVSGCMGRRGRRRRFRAGEREREREREEVVLMQTLSLSSPAGFTKNASLLVPHKLLNTEKSSSPFIHSVSPHLYFSIDDRVVGSGPERTSIVRRETLECVSPQLCPQEQKSQPHLLLPSTLENLRSATRASLLFIHFMASLFLSLHRDHERRGHHECSPWLFPLCSLPSPPAFFFDRTISSPSPPRRVTIVIIMKIRIFWGDPAVKHVATVQGEHKSREEYSETVTVKYISDPLRIEMGHTKKAIWKTTWSVEVLNRWW